MLKSEITRVSGPSSASRRRSGSGSPQQENGSKRTRRSESPSSGSESNDYDDEEEGELPSKATSSVIPKSTAPAVVPRTGGLYMPPAKLRLLQVDRFDQ